MTDKILILDIETSPYIVYTWGMYQQDIGLNQIINERTIMAAAWKWLGKDKVGYMDTSKQLNHRDDKALVKHLVSAIDLADIVIGQNSDEFDLRVIASRAIMHDIKPPSPVVSIDTKKMAKQVAMFTSNRLEWLSKHLTDAPKSEHGEFPGFDLWKECLDGNPRAWAAMKRYNIQDVRATEKLYLRLRPWVKRHPHVVGAKSTACPRCAGVSLERRGTDLQGRQRYRCGTCGGWSHALISGPLRS